MTELDMEHVYPPRKHAEAAAEPQPMPLWTTVELLNANHAALQERVAVLEAQRDAIPWGMIRALANNAYNRKIGRPTYLDFDMVLPPIYAWLDTHAPEVQP